MRLKTLCAGAVRSLRVVVTLFWAAAGFFLSKFQDSAMRFGTEEKPTGCRKEWLFFFYSPSRLLSSLNISSLSSHFLCLSLTHQRALDPPPPTLPPTPLDLIVLSLPSSLGAFKRQKSPSPVPFLQGTCSLSLCSSSMVSERLRSSVLFCDHIRQAACPPGT